MDIGSLIKPYQDHEKTPKPVPEGMHTLTIHLRFNGNCTEAGCTVTWPMMDAFWGDRMGKIKDPFGHTWAVASWKWLLTPEEMKQRQEEWEKTLK